MDQGMSGDGGAPPEPVLEVPPPQEIKILESAEDIQVRAKFLIVFCIQCQSAANFVISRSSRRLKLFFVEISKKKYQISNCFLCKCHNWLIRNNLFSNAILNRESVSF
ncbi:unnamed protein product [Gongylonema pulchrum]|uniref:Uncharacterized protein n=1 Tax=Gongylonema pulchrum TaxID=637853 RepID=A0A183EYA8_9BILA|nr:unnamed protein product [Gongylonema pulchrum]